MLLIIHHQIQSILSETTNFYLFYYSFEPQCAGASCRLFRPNRSLLSFLVESEFLKTLFFVRTHKPLFFAAFLVGEIHRLYLPEEKAELCRANCPSVELALRDTELSTNLFFLSL